MKTKHFRVDFDTNQQFAPIYFQMCEIGTQKYKT